MASHIDGMMGSPNVQDTAWGKWGYGRMDPFLNDLGLGLGLVTALASKKTQDSSLSFNEPRNI